jgi:hypothetical protein
VGGRLKLLDRHEAEHRPEERFAISHELKLVADQLGLPTPEMHSISYDGDLLLTFRTS